MAKIVEFYPDAESVKEKVELRKKFGWSSSVKTNDRDVYEVTFTRDETKDKNKKLKELEDDFTQCTVASDYIKRYNRVYANKDKFKALPTIVIVILIYLMVQLGVMALVSIMFKAMYSSDPNSFYDLGLKVVAGGESVPISPDWKFDVNLEEIGLSGILSIFGVSGPILTLDVELLINALFVVGLLSLAGFILILFFMIKKKSTARTFYKAEVEYIDRRKKRLKTIMAEIEEQMEHIMLEAEKVA